MATPTPGKYPGVAATPPVSTPFSTSHLAFSPHGPRSVVPSPSQIKKSSPAGTSMSNQGYNMGMVGFDSPSAALALGMGADVVGDLGIDLHGIGALGGGPGKDEEEKRRRLMACIEILKPNKGRLSEAGLERLARRVGLECLWEDSMGGASNGRTLIIAGNALALDIDFANNIVQKVSLSFPDAPESVTKHEKTASDILLKDLQFEAGESPLTKMLDRFAANLERLTMLDKLSVIPGLNCHEAVAGIYCSLHKLYNWELSRLGENDMLGMGDEEIVKAAMCIRSGIPVMHSRKRLGLSLDYWQEKRRIPTKEKEKNRKTWSLLVEVAPLPSLVVGVYTPLRVSDKWISDDIQKADPAVDELFQAAQLRQGPILDWLEPDNTLLPSNSDNKTDGLDVGAQKFPEAIFVAKFDPPIIVPYAIAMQIYQSTQTPFDFSEITTFDGLMFPLSAEEALKTSETQARTINMERNVPVWDREGKKRIEQHSNTLFIEKIDYGRQVEEVSFSHPRQLVEMLPCLRQFAFLSTILRKSFGAEENSKLKSKERDSSKVDTVSKSPEPEIINPPTKKREFEDFMKGLIATPTRTSTSIAKQEKGKKDKSKHLDVSLTLTPVPRVQVVFDFKKRSANVVFEIQGNGGVVVVDENVLRGVTLEGDDVVGEEKGRIPTRDDLGRVLEVCEDLGVWVEWVRRRL
ncbi:4fc531f6-db86-4b65-af28-981d616be6c7 [Sclerotinia trifoliorum]|uniref:Mediator of RNA polymerase II transcription subunit 1 n=1 Tax=Sclerotinia trifoliorum TaxID=28548 RepID=A0A8H2ZN40_9HELO|nr:4fc531f6-db86-4b65-af28-981d616be6c7 [Sclerotinia trifoliorum]